MELAPWPETVDDIHIDLVVDPFLVFVSRILFLLSCLFPLRLAMILLF